MDKEAFAKLLPEGAGTAITDWAQEQKEELGDRAYTVYRCERRYAEAAMEDLFENRTRGSRYWATLCNCTVCGEEWYTRKGTTADSFFIVDGEDGCTYPTEAAEAASKEAGERLQKLESAKAAAEQKAKAAEAALEEARKQQVLSSPEAAVFRVLFQKVQEDFQQMAGALTQVEQKDPELAEKLRGAVRKLLASLEGKANG